MAAPNVLKQVKPAATVRLKLIALPTEHGGWGLLGAPLLLGLLLRPSVAGAFLGLAALGAFLARHPFKLWAGDLMRGKRFPRTTWALRFVGLYGMLAAFGLLGATLLGPVKIWSPLLFIAALGTLDLWIELTYRGRSLGAEVMGAVTLCLLPWPLVVAGGGSLILGVVASTFLGLQAIGALLYVRARLHLEREGRADKAAPFFATGLAAALAILGAVFYGLVWWTLPLYLLMLVRAVWGLSPWRKRVRPGVVGIQEVAYSVATVVALYFTLR